MSKQIREVNGVRMYVTVCKPSRRKAGTSIQKCRHTRNSVGANWLARDKGLSCLNKSADAKQINS